jgi:flavin-binding protein dodecin
LLLRSSLTETERAVEGRALAHWRVACGDFVAALAKRWNRAACETEDSMADAVYKVITLVGSSTESWEQAASAAIAQAAHSLRDLRVGKVTEQDIHIEEGRLTYRVKLEVSFKYEGGS